jgi:hypothetical protein
MEKFPTLYLKIIAAVILIVAIFVSAKLISNYRMDRLLKSALEPDTELEKARAPSAGEKAPAETLESKEEPVSAQIAELMSEMEKLGIHTDQLSDEKQLKIYELAKKNYSIAEIARMLNMGQEEVKFILDFRMKTQN